MAGIKEVANRAGVSTATVSRYLNKDKKLTITNETKNKILEAVNYYGYKQKKRAKKNINSIGVITWLSFIGEMDDPYFRAIHTGVEEEAKNQSLKIDDVFRLCELESIENIEKLDGLIVIGQIGDSLLREIHSRNKNILVIDSFETSREFDSVYVDLQHATIENLNRLYSKKHRNIAFIGGIQKVQGFQAQEDIEYDDVRYLTYLNWMKENGLEHYIKSFLGDWTITEGARLCNEFIDFYQDKEMPTAIMVASDPMAVGVHRELQARGFKIPEDISLVSFDNIEVVEFLTPSLSSIRFDAEEMGRIGVRLLKERIDNIRSTPVRVSISGNVIIRESEQCV